MADQLKDDREEQQRNYAEKERMRGRSDDQDERDDLDDLDDMDDDTEEDESTF